MSTVLQVKRSKKKLFNNWQQLVVFLIENQNEPFTLDCGVDGGYSLVYYCSITSSFFFTSILSKLENKKVAPKCFFPRLALYPSTVEVAGVEIVPWYELLGPPTPKHLREYHKVDIKEIKPRSKGILCRFLDCNKLSIQFVNITTYFIDTDGVIYYGCAEGDIYKGNVTPVLPSNCIQGAINEQE